MNLYLTLTLLLQGEFDPVIGNCEGILSFQNDLFRNMFYCILYNVFNSYYVVSVVDPLNNLL